MKLIVCLHFRMVLNDLKSHHIHKAHENVVRKYNNFQNWHRCVHCLDEYFQEDQELIDHNLKEHKEKNVQAPTEKGTVATHHT